MNLLFSIRFGTSLVQNLATPGWLTIFWPFNKMLVNCGFRNKLNILSVNVNCVYEMILFCWIQCFAPDVNAKMTIVWHEVGYTSFNIHTIMQCVCIHRLHCMNSTQNIWLFASTSQHQWMEHYLVLDKFLLSKLFYCLCRTHWSMTKQI